MWPMLCTTWGLTPVTVANSLWKAESTMQEATQRYVLSAGSARPSLFGDS
jgi:hypothetical protein